MFNVDEPLRTGSTSPTASIRLRRCAHVIRKRSTDRVPGLGEAHPLQTEETPQVLPGYSEAASDRVPARRDAAPVPGSGPPLQCQIAEMRPPFLGSSPSTRVTGRRYAPVSRKQPPAARVPFARDAPRLLGSDSSNRAPGRRDAPRILGSGPLLQCPVAEMRIDYSGAIRWKHPLSGSGSVLESLVVEKRAGRGDACVVRVFASSSTPLSANVFIAPYTTLPLEFVRGARVQNKSSAVAVREPPVTFVGTATVYIDIFIVPLCFSPSIPIVNRRN